MSYSKKMDRDVLNSPASLNYSPRCTVNKPSRNVTDLRGARALRTFSFGLRKTDGNGDVAMPFVRYH